MFDRSAIVLAAGLSRRMGATNKLLLPIGDMPMIRHVVRAYGVVCDGPITVVTGYARSEIKKALYGLAPKLLYNPDFGQGRKTSVLAGLSAAAPAQDTFIGLGDQPLLSAEALSALLNVHHAGPPGRITVPMRGRDRGNPLIVPHALMARLMADPRSPGCRKFTQDHPELVNFAPMAQDAFFIDLDTPEDVARHLQAEAHAP